MFRSVTILAFHIFDIYYISYKTKFVCKILNEIQLFFLQTPKPYLQCSTGKLSFWKTLIVSRLMKAAYFFIVHCKIYNKNIIMHTTGHYLLYIYIYTLVTYMCTIHAICLKLGFHYLVVSIVYKYSRWQQLLHYQQ